MLIYFRFPPRFTFFCFVAVARNMRTPFLVNFRLIITSMRAEIAAVKYKSGKITNKTIVIIIAIPLI